MAGGAGSVEKGGSREGGVLSWKSGDRRWPELLAFFEGDVLVVASGRGLLEEALECAGRRGGCPGEPGVAETSPGGGKGAELHLRADLEWGRDHFPLTNGVPPWPAADEAVISAGLGKETEIRFAVAGPGGQGERVGAGSGKGLLLPSPAERPVFLAAQRGVDGWSGFPRWLAGSGDGSPDGDIGEWCLAVTGFTDRGLVPLPRWQALAGGLAPGRARPILGSFFPAGERGPSYGGIETILGRSREILGGEYRPGGAALGEVLLIASDPEILKQSIDRHRAGAAGPEPGVEEELDVKDGTFLVAYIDGARVYPVVKRLSFPLAALLENRFGAGPDYRALLDLTSHLRTGTLRLDRGREGVEGVVRLSLDTP